MTKSRRKRLAKEVSLERAKSIFGNARPPVSVWERQFDYFDDHLQRIARTPLEEIDRGDLWYYYHDLAYAKLQPDLFHYLFPLCLWDWHLSLQENLPCSHGDSEFHYSIVNGRVFGYLTSWEQTNEISAFFRDSMLFRLDQERAISHLTHYDLQNAHAWMMRFNSLGLINPFMQDLWKKWWEISSPGHAIAAIQYISNLMYFDDENPILAVPGMMWSRTRPYLSGTDSWCHAGWLSENVDFVRQYVTVKCVQTTLKDAVEQLQSTGDAAAAQEILKEFSDRLDLVKARIRDLPDILAAPECVGEWTV